MKFNTILDKLTHIDLGDGISLRLQSCDITVRAGNNAEIRAEWDAIIEKPAAVDELLASSNYTEPDHIWE